MPKTLKRLGISICVIGTILLVSMLFVKFPVATQVPYEVQRPYQTQVPYEIQVAYNETETQNEVLDHKETYQIQSGHYAYSHFDLDAGKTLVVTWQVDRTVSIYITNPTQFSSASLLGFPTSSLARQVGVQSGTLSYEIPSFGTYYVIIHPYSGDVNVASYKSELQWQQEMTKYRNETQYRTETQYRSEIQYMTETIYSSSTLGINSGIGLVVLGSLAIGFSFVNLKPISFKKLKSSTCAYCNSTYSKKVDKCPNCGARKRETKIIKE